VRKVDKKSEYMQGLYRAAEVVEGFDLRNHFGRNISKQVAIMIRRDWKSMKREGAK